jgi:hypothetical protein
LTITGVLEEGEVNDQIRAATHPSPVHPKNKLKAKIAKALACFRKTAIKVGKK